MNAAEGEAGSIYLFESEGAAQALNGPIVAALRASPAVSAINATLFDILETHAAITKGPVQAIVQRS